MAVKRPSANDFPVFECLVLERLISLFGDFSCGEAPSTQVWYVRSARWNNHSNLPWQLVRTHRPRTNPRTSRFCVLRGHHPKDGLLPTRAMGGDFPLGALVAGQFQQSAVIGDDADPEVEILG